MEEKKIRVQLTLWEVHLLRDLLAREYRRRREELRESLKRKDEEVRKAIKRLDRPPKAEEDKRARFRNRIDRDWIEFLIFVEKAERDELKVMKHLLKKLHRRTGYNKRWDALDDGTSSS